MKRNQDKDLADRRSFLKLAGIGAVTASAALVTGAATADADEARESDRLYRETDHVRTFYRMARF